MDALSTWPCRTASPLTAKSGTQHVLNLWLGMLGRTGFARIRLDPRSYTLIPRTQTLRGVPGALRRQH